MLNRRRLNAFRRGTVAVLTAAVAATVWAGAPAPASGANGTLTVGITPGRPIAIAIAPLPAGVLYDDRTPLCVEVAVKTSLHGWSLSATYATTSPSAPAVVLAPRPAGQQCATSETPYAETRLDGRAAAVLATNRSGSETLAYICFVHPTGRSAAASGLTLIFTAVADGVPEVTTPLALAVDRAGRVSAAPGGH